LTMRITIKVSTVAAVGATTEVRRCTDTMLLLFHGHFFLFWLLLFLFLSDILKQAWKREDPKDKKVEEEESGTPVLASKSM